MEQRATDRQSTPAFTVHFRPTLSSAPHLEGTGVLQDLSMFGCRIESSVTMLPNISVTLDIEVPNWDSPVTIEVARVQWVNGQVFGLGAFQISEKESDRLQRVIRGLVEG